MSATTPQNWNTYFLGEVCQFIGGNGFREELQGRDNGEYPFIKVSDMELPGNKIHVINSNNWIEKITLKREGFKTFPENTVVFAKVGAALLLNRRRILTRDTCIDNNMMAAIPFGIEYRFLYYLLSSIDFADFVQSGAVPSINQNQLSNIQFDLPPKTEQSKIAEVLLTVDQAIEQTEELIAKQQRIKTGLMQDLLTKGIDEDGNLRSEETHAFKDSPLGRIPVEWEILKLRDILDEISEPISMKNDIYYQLISIRRRNGGIFKREILPGKKILTKDLHRVIPGTFLIANRQIVHGACAYVTDEFKDTVVSSAYTTLKGKENCNTRFFSWVAKTPLMYKYFLNASQGVVIEKMNFHLDEWLEFPLFMPPLSEQEDITKVFESINYEISKEEEYLKKLFAQKTALMQDLLTGTVRVTPLLDKTPESTSEGASA